MPIRIRRHDKPLNRQQAIEYKGITTPSARNPKACYADRKPILRILCGSIIVLPLKDHGPSGIVIVGGDRHDNK